jgi:hypothetical protein
MTAGVDVPHSPVSTAEHIVQDYEARLERQRRVLADAELVAMPVTAEAARVILHALEHFAGLARLRLIRLQELHAETT